MPGFTFTRRTATVTIAVVAGYVLGARAYRRQDRGHAAVPVTNDLSADRRVHQLEEAVALAYHELAQPITILHGYTHLLSNRLEDRQAEMRSIQHMERATRQLLELMTKFRASLDRSGQVAHDADHLSLSISALSLDASSVFPVDSA